MSPGGGLKALTRPSRRPGMAPRLPALLAIVVGVALLVSPAVLVPHAGQARCVTFVEPVDGDELPSTAEVLVYDALTADAKRAFDRARAAPDGRAAVYGGRCPPEFVYTNVVREYFVQRSGQTYVLETAGGGRFPVDLFIALGFGLLGVALVGLGARAGARGETTPVRALVYGGLAGLGVIALLAAAAGTTRVVVLGLTALGTTVAYLVIGFDFPARWAIGLGGLASIGVGAVLAATGVQGSAVAVVLVPIALTGLGVVGWGLRRELFP